MTVRRLRAEMPQAEWVDWIVFFEWRAAQQKQAQTKAEQAPRHRRAPGR